MLPCPKCRHSNSDDAAICSACGSPLRRRPAPVAPSSGIGISPGQMPTLDASAGMEEFHRMMAARAAKQKRNQMITAAAVLVALGGGGAWLWREKKRAAAVQGVLEAGGRFAERDKAEMGAFWNCVTSSEVDVGMFQSADQIQQRVESAYFTQQKTFSEYLTSECVPKIERARGAMASMVGELPPGVKEAGDRYLASLPKLQAGIEAYAEKIKGRGALKDIDQTIQEVGTSFTADVTAESVAFEKFLVCAVPDLDKKKDIQGVLEFLAATCKSDAVPFMKRVREVCGPLLQNLAKDSRPEPSKTFKANAKKLVEEDQRQLQAWDYCARRSRKGKKVLDLEDFLTASGDYIESRSEVVRAAREAASRIAGKPIEGEKKEPGKMGAPAGE